MRRAVETAIFESNRARVIDSASCVKFGPPTPGALVESSWWNTSAHWERVGESVTGLAGRGAGVKMGVNWAAYSEALAANGQPPGEAIAEAGGGDGISRAVEGQELAGESRTVSGSPRKRIGPSQGPGGRGRGGPGLGRAAGGGAPSGWARGGRDHRAAGGGPGGARAPEKGEEEEEEALEGQLSRLGVEWDWVRRSRNRVLACHMFPTCQVS